MRLAVVRFLAERPTFFATFLTAFLAAAFLVAVPFGVALRLTNDLDLVFVGFLLAAVLFVAARFGVAVRLTGVLVLTGFFFATIFFATVRFGVGARLAVDLASVFAAFVALRLVAFAVRFRFDDVEADLEARLGFAVRART